MAKGTKRTVDDLKDEESSESEPAKRSSRARKVVSYNEDKLAEAASEPKEPETSSTPKKKLREDIAVHPERKPLPTRNADGDLVFPDRPEFRPNLTPKEIFQMGSFGGTYYRTIYSSVVDKTLTDVWKEFPKDWFEGLDVAKWVSSPDYDENVNKYKVKCGQSLEAWEGSGWISSLDPFGQFQWYCRFYLGRRSDDDARQISRANGVIGPRGRWRNNLTNRILASVGPNKSVEQALEDYTISPVVRQLLQHWGYKLTLKDLKAAQRANK